ncbi:MAG: hypothetical protein ABJA71_08835, partial [Ginsengibacter sp.]
MKNSTRGYKRYLRCLVTALVISCSVTAQRPVLQKNAYEKGSANLNITDFGVVKTWINTTDPLGQSISYDDFNKRSTNDSSDIGIFWWDARDIQRIEVEDKAPIIGESSKMPVVQYWYQSWPETPPKMPSKEDLEDDPWQGKWITAATDVKVSGNLLVYTFKPMTPEENPNTVNLPEAVTYRRTLKARLLYTGRHEPVKSIQVFST